MDKQQLREKAKKFYQAAYFDDESQAMSKVNRNPSTDLAVPLNEVSLKHTNSAPAVMQKQWTISQIQRHEKGDHTFRNVLLFLLFAGVFIFGIDLYKETQHQRTVLEVKRKRCHQEYQQNQCENPVEAIREKCHQLEVCYSQEADMALRTTQTAAKLLGRLVESFLRETGWWGAFFVVFLLGIMLIFIHKASKTSTTQEVTMKKE